MPSGNRAMRSPHHFYGAKGKLIELCKSAIGHCYVTGALDKPHHHHFSLLSVGENAFDHGNNLHFGGYHPHNYGYTVYPLEN